MVRRHLSFTRRRTSGRMFVLITILFLLALTLAPPMKHYFTQRAQINSLNAQLASDNNALERARKELLLWQDPEYVKSQARARLHFVLPGERQYIVTEGNTSLETTVTTTVAKALVDGQPWYIRLIASISESGDQ